MRSTALRALAQRFSGRSGAPDLDFARSDRSRGAPGTLRDAPGTPLERLRWLEVDLGSLLGARVPPGSNFWLFLALISVVFSDQFGGQIVNDFVPTFPTGRQAATVG